MSILNVNKINPVGGGSTITITGIASVTNNITAIDVTATGTITGEHHGDGSNLTNLPVLPSDINNLINNVAILGFKVATNGSLAKYNLVNQVIDEFTDASGIDASASTNENLVDGYFRGASEGGYPTGGTVTTYSSGGTTYRVHSFLSSANFVASSSGVVDMLIVGGGGGGGNYLGGGGGGGAVLHVQNRTISAGTYAVVRGDGGAGGATNTSDGQIGSGSYFGSDYASTNLYARPGGAASGHGNGSASTSGTYATVVASTAITGTGNGGGGASAGASAGQGATPTTRTVTAPSGETWTLYSNQAGGNGTHGGSHASGGGGGADNNGVANSGAWGNGGPGIQINITGNNYYWGGGGGGGSINRPSSGGNGGIGGGGGGGHQNNGGGSGGGSALNAGAAAGGHTAGGDGGANTGGGGGGGSHGDYDGGDGGTGIVIVRYANNQFLTTADLTLQSVDTTAVDGAPTKADLIILMENGVGTATLNTDIKGFISRDSGTTFTQGTLIDEGSYGTSTKRIVAFHDLDISSQPSGTSVCYKITTHNQSAASKETRITAVSHGWK